MTARDRVLSRTRRRGECLVFTGSRDAQGYGMARDDTGRVRRAHIIVYMAARGPVPAGLELDHTCRNTSCVALCHLEAVTHRENVRRTGRGSEPTCVHGHPYDEANTYRRKNGARGCRACQSRFNRGYRERKRHG